MVFCTGIKKSYTRPRFLTTLSVLLNEKAKAEKQEKTKNEKYLLYVLTFQLAASRRSPMKVL